MEMDITFSLPLTLLLLKIFTLTSSNTISNITTDQDALLAFKTSITSDPLNLLTKNWSTNTPTCSWAGVSCGLKHRRVTALNVSGYQLVGTFPPHLGNLTFLRSLDISSNKFTGSIPSELSNLRRLEEINIGFNNLTGEIRPWLGALPQLQSIYMSNNSFSGTLPNAVFNISSLMEIDLRYNQLSGQLPDDICSNTPTLTSLYLTGNQFSGEIPRNIYKCRGMEDLRLGGNSFNGSIPSEIGSLSMLTILALWSNQFTGSIPSSIVNMTSLETMSLFGNHLSGNIPSSIFNMSSLITMDLSENQLSGSIPNDTPYNLLHIQELSLYHNHLTGGIPKQFGNLTSLAVLDVSSNILTGELPKELGNLASIEVLLACYNNLSGPLPSSIFNISTLTGLWLQENLLNGSIPSNMGLSVFSLQNLILHYNRFTGQIPAAITNASELIILELNRNFLTGPIPNFGNLRNLQALRLWENNLTAADSPTQEWGFVSSLTNCRYLQILEITDNPLNGVLPASIGNLSSSLKRFWASDCNISGDIPTKIGNLSKLLFLQLRGNRITGFIPKTISKLNQLQELHLDENRLQGDIPSELCQLSNLGTLNLSYNMLTGSVHDCLGELKFLREVYLASNKLNSTIPPKFWDLSHLVNLDLSLNDLSGQVSSRIGTWEVNQLDLSSNQFTGNIPSSIGGCLSLEFLSLSNNKFGGLIPDTLGDVKGLRTLNLSHNDLSGVIPITLEDLRVLEYFDVSYNRLEGDIPDGIANSSTAQSFVHNSALCGAAKFQVPRCRDKRSRSKSIALIFVKYVLPPFVVATIVVGVVLMFIRRRKQVIKPPPVSDISLEKITRISYAELVRGTSSFSETNLLGSGSFGSVFKATLSDGLDIAVKVFNLQLEGAAKSFDTESEILSSIRHRNLVSVISCCTNADFRALILEYMPNGSLDKWLHNDSYVLDLVQRLNVAIDVALALEYLHHGHTFPVVHCDIKPSNVLLDKDMTAHVADFGISKLFDEGEVMTHTTTLATIGYAAPEYGSEGKISTKGDVYSYGILLLEMFTRKKPTDDMFSDEMSLKDWVDEGLQENAASEIMAPDLVSSEDQHFSAKEECISSVFEMAMKCLAFSPDKRINMVQVVSFLRKIKAKVTAAIEVNNRPKRR